MDNTRNSLDRKLQQLLSQAVASPARSCQRRKALNEVVRLIQQSGRLRRGNFPEYQEALQNTWLYLCQCPEKYDPKRGSVINWFNATLNFRLRDVYKAIKRDQDKRIIPGPADTDFHADPIENIPAPDAIPPMLEHTLQWIEADSKEVLRNTQMRTRSDITCQILLLRRFPPSVRWDSIAEEFCVSRSAVVMFYLRKCLPLLRQFGVEQGYLDEEFKDTTQ